MTASSDERIVIRVLVQVHEKTRRDVLFAAGSL